MNLVAQDLVAVARSQLGAAGRLLPLVYDEVRRFIAAAREAAAQL